ncbi:MAG: leucine-rich repeat domain-containing protein [Treponema sp.]|jgi:hypothetical protein|nr:leucine-rich repeat domain-containing protein [Treponema sp.]
MKKHINILFACVIMGVFALAGCENPATEMEPAGPSGAVVVTLGTPWGAGTNGARTIYPAALDGLEFTRYELSFPSGPVAHEPVGLIAGENPPILLVAGQWVIRVTAYSGAGEDEAAILGGESASFYITDGETTPVSVTLGTNTAGAAGTLSYSVTAPEGAEGSLTVQTATQWAVEGGTIPLEAGVNEDTLSLPAGEYRLSVSLSKAEHHAGRTEILHIYPDMTSTATYTFAEDDFIGVQTLNPAYGDFTGVVGATLLPSNAATISAAKGGNTAVFAIVGGGTDVATIDAGTGRLTLVETGELTVSLIITTASGVATHMGQAWVNVTRRPSHGVTAPDPKTENGVIATVTLVPAGPQEVIGTTVTARVTLSGTVAAAGAFTIDLVSAKAALVTSQKTKTVAASDQPTDTYNFTFTMPDQDVDDFVFTFIFTPSLGGSVTISDTTPEFGQVLTADATDITGSDNLLYQWIRGIGTLIGSPSADNTYTVDAADVPYTLKVRVTASDAIGQIDSDATSPVAKVAAIPPVYTASAPSAAADVQITSVAGSASGTTKLTFTLAANPANEAAYLEYAIAASAPAGGGTAIPASGTPTGNITTTNGDKVWIRVKETPGRFPGGWVVGPVVTASPGLDPATIANAGSLSAYITTYCMGGTAGSPAAMKFTGAISAANLAAVRDAVDAAGTYVIWDLSEVTGSLTAVGIGGALYNIGSSSAQPGSDKIKGLILPAGMTSIGDRAFQSCSSLTSITLPAGLTSIGQYGFAGCTGLTRITLPASLESIGGYAFMYCSGGYLYVTVLRETEPLTTLGISAFANTGTAGIGVGVLIYVPSAKLADYKAIWSQYESYIH